MWQSSLLFILLTCLCLPLLEFELYNTSPMRELKLMLTGFMHPEFVIDGITNALLHTLSFAIQAVVFSALIGFLFAQIYKFPGIKALMTALRSVHELFWALLLIQLFGLSKLTGLLALAIPFSATFARVFAEIQQETSKKTFHQLNGGHFSRLIYSTLPLAWPRLISYSRYRLECALRASVILGFIGLPTIGFHLEAYLKLGRYAEVSALIMVFIVLVLSMKFWTNRYALLVIFAASIIWLPPTNSLDMPAPQGTEQTEVPLDTSTSVSALNGRLTQFIQDITPAPFKVDNLTLWQWFLPILNTQIIPGVGYTLILGQFAFALSALFALFGFGLISKHLIHKKILRGFGFLALTTLRCLPELLLAFIALIILGPSLLPGIFALAVHNGAILAHLLGQYSNELKLRNDLCTAPNIYFFELLPRIYGQFLAFTLYRGETILRETAILGILGIPTLGFYIDSAFEEFRLDRAVLLILASAILNIFAETLATRFRQYIYTNKAKQEITYAPFHPNS